MPAADAQDERVVRRAGVDNGRRAGRRRPHVHHHQAVVDDQRGVRRQRALQRIAGRRGGRRRRRLGRRAGLGRGRLVADAARVGDDGAQDAAHPAAGQGRGQLGQIGGAHGGIAAAAKINVAGQAAVLVGRRPVQLGPEAPVGAQTQQRRGGGQDLLVRRRIHQVVAALLEEQPAAAGVHHAHADAQPAQRAAVDDLAQRLLHAHDALAVLVVLGRHGRLLDVARRRAHHHPGLLRRRGRGGGHRPHGRRGDERRQQRRQESPHQSPPHQRLPAQRKPRSPSRCSGSQALRLAARGPTKKLQQDPPRTTRRAGSWSYLSATHSQTLPARSSTP